MMKKKKGNSKNKKSAIATSKSKQLFIKILSSIGIITLTAITTAYSSTIQNIITTSIPNIRNSIEDYIWPIDDDKYIGVNLRFYIPSDIDKKRSMEAVSLMINSTQCKQPDGFKFGQVFEDQYRDSYTKVFIQVSCRSSGRIQVKLTPLNGEITTVYDSVLKDWDRLSFSGVAGSYTYGEVIVTTIPSIDPDPPKIPVNKCLIGGNCDNSPKS